MNEECGWTNDERWLAGQQTDSCRADTIGEQAGKSPHLQIFPSDATSALFVPHVEPNRFSFPRLPEPADHPSENRSSIIAWPEGRDTKSALACAAMADSLIHQLSGEDIATTSARREHRVVGLTSATEDDSKLELLLNLAPRLAERILGEILVVDAQMQKSELTKRLSGAKNASIGQKSLIYPTTCHRLNVLPMCQNPGGRKFDDSWMDELRERWFLTLLDMPSLENADAVALAGRCDGVYLAVRLGRTPRRSVVQASRAIQYAGGQLLGCLVIA